MADQATLRAPAGAGTGPRSRAPCAPPAAKGAISTTAPSCARACEEGRALAGSFARATRHPPPPRPAPSRPRLARRAQWWGRRPKACARASWPDLAFTRQWRVFRAQERLVLHSHDNVTHGVIMHDIVPDGSHLLPCRPLSRRLDATGKVTLHVAERLYCAVGPVDDGKHWAVRRIVADPGGIRLCLPYRALKGAFRRRPRAPLRQVGLGHASHACGEDYLMLERPPRTCARGAPHAY